VLSAVLATEQQPHRGNDRNHDEPTVCLPYQISIWSLRVLHLLHVVVVGRKVGL
jgi:hypothetical protein